MKILLDEHLSYRVASALPGHDCESVGYRNWSGLKNGALLSAAEIAGFDVLLTLDDMRKEQDVTGRSISILLVRTPKQGMASLIEMADRILEVLDRIGPGEIAEIERP